MAKLETISETTSPAPKRRACRRTNQLPIPASGASTTRLGTGTPPSDQGSFKDIATSPMVGILDMDLGEIIKPWTEVVTKQVPDLELFDAHTHIVKNDPYGMKCTPKELYVTLH